MRKSGARAVHVFVTTGRFRDVTEVCAFIDETYTSDGDGIPSPFMTEVGLEQYEPGCIEAIHAGRVVSLPELLADASYAEQWIRHLPAQVHANAAICVYEPNVVRRPQDSSLTYLGAFEYHAP